MRNVLMLRLSEKFILNKAAEFAAKTKLRLTSSDEECKAIKWEEEGAESEKITETTTTPPDTANTDSPPNKQDDCNDETKSDE